MNIDLYFEPVDFSGFECAGWTQKKFTIAGLLEKNHEKLKPEKADLVIFGVGEDRNALISGSAKAPDTIREHLYSLNRIAPRLKILDLGNLKTGNSENDTYFAVKDVCESLRSQGKTIIIMGGSQDLTFGITKSFENEPFKMVSVDPKFDFRKGVKTIDSETYLNLIFGKQKNMLSHTILGYQSYFTDPLEFDQLSPHSCDMKRLGQIRYDMAQVEPVLRNANIFSFDVNAIRSVDAPGQYFASPNGLYAEEACQLARYAGMADKIGIAGFFNVIPGLDKQDITSKLMAQVIWHFIEGFHCRIVETPGKYASEFNQFIIDMEDVDLPLTFYQSRKTGRWWMEIRDAEEEKRMMVPCTEDDYQAASRNEIPDRWWKNLQILDRCYLSQK
ncbi:MAG: formimidoylglutamase [Prolixibacteraceae bacterium]|jgi:arginase family enzyme|nr:formimidoylglutamase [Prolixibacteraceae bacterium]